MMQYSYERRPSPQQQQQQPVVQQFSNPFYTSSLPLFSPTPAPPVSSIPASNTFRSAAPTEQQFFPPSSLSVQQNHVVEMKTTTDTTPEEPLRHLRNLQGKIIQVTAGYDDEMRMGLPQWARGSLYPPDLTETKGRRPIATTALVRLEGAPVQQSWPDSHIDDVSLYIEDHPTTEKVEDREQWGYWHHNKQFLFNAILGKNIDGGTKWLTPEWHTFINPIYDPATRKKNYLGLKWICKSPSYTRFPSVYIHTTLCFNLTPYETPLKAIWDKLESCIQITIPAEHLRAYFGDVKSIMVDALWINEVHSTFREPLSVSLHSKNHYLQNVNGGLSWFNQQGPNSNTSLAKPTFCDHIVYPNTHHSEPQLVYTHPPCTDHAEFQRWMGASKQDLWQQMATAVDPTNRAFYKILGMSPGAIHPQTILQFLVITEWIPRIIDDAERLSPGEPQKLAYIEGREDLGKGIYMVVHTNILGPIATSKFEGEMDRSKYLMRVDQDLTLELRLKTQNTSATDILASLSARPDERVSFAMKVGIKYDPWLGKD